MVNSVAATERSIPTAAGDGGSTRVGGGYALQFLRGLATELSGGSVDLPSFPDVIIRIRQALEDPRSSPDRMARLVGSEPRLAARLMQTANSATFNVSGKPVTELRAAITRLGQQLVQSVAMTCAVQQMKDAPALREMAVPLEELWKTCIAVASICQVIARRTKVSPDEAFLCGLMHAIGRLYIMVRSSGQSRELSDPAFAETVAGWHPSIGKAVLENWGFPEKMCEAVGSQAEYQRACRSEVDLTDVLIAGIVLADCLALPAPRSIDVEGISAFQRIGLSAQECGAILTHAEYQLASLSDALGF
jgi:HD-like signal output (HDOD) protein